MVSEETLVLLEAPPGPGTGVEAGEPHGYALAETFQRGKRQERKVSPPSLCPLFFSLPTSSFPPSFLPLCLLLPPLPSPLPLFPPLLLSLHPALPLSVPSPEASAPAPAAPSPSPQPPNPSVSAHWLVGRSSLSDPDSPLSLGRLRGSVRLLPVLPPPCPPPGTAAARSGHGDDRTLDETPCSWPPASHAREKAERPQKSVVYA